MIAVCTPCTVVPMSFAMLLIATFMFEPAKLATNWVRASGASSRRPAGRVSSPGVAATAAGSAGVALTPRRSLGLPPSPP